MTAQVLPPTASPQPLTGEKALAFPLNDTLPALGQALQVASGIFWIRMALPFALDHINLWLLKILKKPNRALAMAGPQWTAA